MPEPQPGSAPLEAADYYLSAYFKEFYRVREAVKLRVSIVTWTTTAGSGLVAVLGATSAALSEEPWPRIIGIATALVSSIVTAFVAWEALAQHRRHWIQQTATINSLTRERMWLERQKAEGADPLATAHHVFATLDREFAKDLSEWQRTHERDVGRADASNE